MIFVFIMQVLDAIAVMSIAFSLPVATAKPSIPQCVADPTILSNVPGKFALAVLGYDDQAVMTQQFLPLVIDEVGIFMNVGILRRCVYI